MGGAPEFAAGPCDGRQAWYAGQLCPRSSGASPYRGLSTILGDDRRERGRQIHLTVNTAIDDESAPQSTLAGRGDGAVARPARRTGRTFPDGYDPEATRAALIQSALSLFGERGFSGTSIREVTSGAGVTKGAFYHHFESKEDLLRLIHDEFVDYQLAAMERILLTYDEPGMQIQRLLDEFLTSTARYQANVTVFYQERRYLTGERFQAVMEKRERFDEMFRDTIRRGIDTGVFRADLDPHIVGLGLLGMCAWTYQWFRPGGQFSSSEVAGMFAALVLDGLHPRAATPRPRK